MAAVEFPEPLSSFTHYWNEIDTDQRMIWFISWGNIWSFYILLYRMTQERSPVGKILDMGVSYATWILASLDVESARCQWGLSPPSSYLSKSVIFFSGPSTTLFVLHLVTMMTKDGGLKIDQFNLMFMTCVSTFSYVPCIYSYTWAFYNCKFMTWH